MCIIIIKQIDLHSLNQGWQKIGKYSYFPGQLEILVFTRNYWYFLGNEVQLQITYFILLIISIGV